MANSNIVGGGRQTLSNGSTVEVDPNWGDTLGVQDTEEQVQLVITNDSPITQTSTGVYDCMLYICGMNGKEALGIPPKQAVTLETTSKFKLKAVKNAGSVDVTYIVGQLFARGVFNQLAGGQREAARSAGGGGTEGTGGTTSGYLRTRSVAIT